MKTKEKITTTTKTGVTLEILPVCRMSGGVGYEIKNQNETLKLSNTAFQTMQGKFCVVLKDWQVEKLLSVQIPKGDNAALVIDQPDGEYIIRNAWNEENKKHQRITFEKEINNMNNEDIVTLYAYSGYGMHYVLESEKLSYEVASRIDGIKEILDNVKTEDAPEKNSDVAYKAVMTWGEFQSKLKAKKDAEKQQEEKETNRKKEIFEKAKQTGKKQVLYSEFLTEEDIPKKFREEDSDMGTLTVYAMPDGSTETDFNHAY